MDEIIQLKITLHGTNPHVWRRIQVEKGTTFFELHHIIQIVMGWYNYHLFEFNLNNYRIGLPDEEFDDPGFGNNKFVDATEVTLDVMIIDTKEKLTYEYDFGDGWRHHIQVEKFLPRDKSVSYPNVLDGKLNCPPEDCGGIPGFYNLLEILANKKHPERKEMLEWLGGSYDPEYFDKDELNMELKTLKQYIQDWEDNR